MKAISVSQMRSALRKAVKERGASFVYEENYNTGDYYQGCQYVIAEEPACIAGLALFKLGVPVDVLKSMDKLGYQKTSEVINDPAVLSTLEDAGFSLSTAAITLVEQAQSNQDFGANWGDALRRAEEVVV